MYQQVCVTTKRSYNAAEDYIRSMFRHDNLTEKDKPRIVRIDATNVTPHYYSVMVRMHVADDRREW